MDRDTLITLAKYQSWADSEHWKAIHAHRPLSEDAEVRKRLGHIRWAYLSLQALSRGEAPSPAGAADRESLEALEGAMKSSHEQMVTTLTSADLEKPVSLPRGPRGPFEAPAGVLLMQALLHSQHHRGQNAARMRELGITPPMTDFVVWYALGRP